MLSCAGRNGKEGKDRRHRRLSRAMERGEHLWISGKERCTTISPDRAGLYSSWYHIGTRSDFMQCFHALVKCPPMRLSMLVRNTSPTNNPICSTSRQLRRRRLMRLIALTPQLSRHRLSLLAAACGHHRRDSGPCRWSLVRRRWPLDQKRGDRGSGRLRAALR